LRRIAVYGGTFDPVHNGHLQVAEAILKAFAMDRLLFVPAFVPPHKRGRQISSPFNRMAMLALATAEQPEMLVSTIELEAPQRPYTIDTLGRLQQEYPDARLFFVMGADSFVDITTWREHRRLLTEYDIIIATRPGFDSGGNVETLINHLAPELRSRCVDLFGSRIPSEKDFASPQVYLTDYVAVDVSATSIREQIEKGGPIGDLVPPAVVSFIEKYQLYRK